jgi:MiaB-like tRNA modifying enzyme
VVKALPRIWVESYGCSANIADAEIMMGLLKGAGYELASSPHEADINMIVTCSVKTATASRMITRINELSRTSKPLIVAGCLAKAEPELVQRLNPRASLLGPRTVQRVVEVSNLTRAGYKVVALEPLAEPKVCLPRVRMNPSVAIVEILSGCLSRCSFCQTKLARGYLVSYEPELIVKEVEMAVREGCKQIWLTSQDNSCYGLDIGTNLAELLEKVCQVEGDFMVRVGMMNPLHLRRFLPQLIRAYRHPKVFKFLHIPVQTGSDRLLRLMRRGYSIDEFKHYVREFRREIPEITIATDIIAGFPTETEDDLRATMELLEEVKPDVVNLSSYSPRPHTDAATMPQVPREVVKRRTSLLTEFCKAIMYERNRRWLGWRGKAIVEERVKGAYVARNFAYKPIIVRGSRELGEAVDVAIASCTAFCLYDAPGPFGLPS